jgi:integrase
VKGAIRYPKKGPGNGWTVVELNAIPPHWKGTTLGDGDGLFGEVRVSVSGRISVRWKYGFKWERRTNWYQVGTYPKVSMSNIRQDCDKARTLLRQGVNPNTHKAAERITAQLAAESVIVASILKKEDELTLGDMFDDWSKNGVKHSDGNAALIALFKNHLLPDLGPRPVRAITDKDLREVLAPLVARNSYRTAELAFSRLKQMFAWAERRPPWRRHLLEFNPVELVEMAKLFPAEHDPSETRSRVLSGEEIKELRQKFLQMEALHSGLKFGERYSIARPVKKETQLALWLCLGTLNRIGETLKAEWAHVDFSARTWFKPKENVKGAPGKRKAHTVYLSDFTLARLKELKALTGSSKWLFPSNADPDAHVDEKSVTKQVGDRQVKFKQRKGKQDGRREDNCLVLGGGTTGHWTPHDLRRTGATMMQELGVETDFIELCQNHTIHRRKVAKTYLRYDYAPEQQDAWCRLGSHLDALWSEAETPAEPPHQARLFSPS